MNLLVSVHGDCQRLFNCALNRKVSVIHEQSSTSSTVSKNFIYMKVNYIRQIKFFRPRLLFLYAMNKSPEETSFLSSLRSTPPPPPTKKKRRVTLAYLRKKKNHPSDPTSNKKVKRTKTSREFQDWNRGYYAKKKLIIIIKKEKRSEPVIIYCMKGERRIFRDSHSFWGEGNGHRQRSRKGGTTRNWLTINCQQNERVIRISKRLTGEPQVNVIVTQPFFWTPTPRQF